MTYEYGLARDQGKSGMRIELKKPAVKIDVMRLSRLDDILWLRFVNTLAVLDSSLCSHLLACSADNIHKTSDDNRLWTTESYLT